MSDNFDVNLAKAVLEGKVKVEDATTVAQAHSEVKKDIGKEEYKSLSPQEIEKLVQYDWPGNVRELKNVLERALFVQKGTELRPSLLLEKSPVARPCAPSRDIDPTMIKTLEESEKEIIRTALQQLSGNLTQTARALGISLSTLKRKIREYRGNTA